MRDLNYNIFQEAIVPSMNRNIVKDYEKKFNSKAIYVYITPYPDCYENCCHQNVEKLVKEYGGYKVTGYYLVSEKDLKKSIAIYHSIWYYNTQVIDPTPFKEGVDYHTFIPTREKYGDFLCL